MSISSGIRTDSLTMEQNHKDDGDDLKVTNTIMYSPFLHVPPIPSHHKSITEIKDNKVGVDIFLLDNLFDQNDALPAQILPWRQNDHIDEEPVLSIQANDTTIYSQSHIDLCEEHHRQIINHRPNLDVREEIKRKECMDYFNNEENSSVSLSLSRSHCAYLIKQLAKAQSNSDDSSINELNNFERFDLDNKNKTELDDLIPTDMKCEREFEYQHDHEEYLIRKIQQFNPETIPTFVCQTCKWIAESNFNEVIDISPENFNSSQITNDDISCNNHQIQNYDKFL